MTEEIALPCPLMRSGDVIVWTDYRGIKRVGRIINLTFDGLFYMRWKWGPWTSTVNPAECRPATEKEIQDYEQ